MSANHRTVINEFNEEVVVDYSAKKIYDYSNKEEVIYYNAPIVENGEVTGFWATFKEAGIVDDISERLSTWNNLVKATYGQIVKYNASKNDPNKEIWKSLVAVISEHPEYCFDSNGDFLEAFTIEPSEIVKGA